MTAYAHTPNKAGEWHDLTKHLIDVALSARQIAAKFGAGELAYWMGLWHDAGKFNPAFQEYLVARNNGREHTAVPHAVWGAALAYSIIWKQQGDAEAWKELALAIAGHHAGLPDAGNLAQKLEEALRGNMSVVQAVAQDLRALPKPPTPPSPMTDRTRRELRLRMAFSALVDADYLDTESHFNPERGRLRGCLAGLQGRDLTQKVEAKRRELAATQSAGTNRRVNQVRQEVYQHCLKAAAAPPGIYRLTVPTGGGKTLSGLAFGLHHAERYGLDRVIVAIPYTSIIDQTAKFYRDVLGSDLVVEHHSQFDPPGNELEDQDAARWCLATENWDAAIIVTTTVQLFESLLGRRPGQVRKLHNLAKSVIILDEVQTLPTDLLEPTLDVLRTLVEDYGVTLVLSTATQPALEDSHYLKPFQGLALTEIVPDYHRHFRDLQRVTYEYRPAPLTWEEVAKPVAAEAQIMVVLNSRRDALRLIHELDVEGIEDVYHVSTLLCGANRRKVLEEITKRLKVGRPVRLICTQVVEAGVDISFPTVWRAMGPIDRIIQAAGRCNREGEWPVGRVVVFEPAEGGVPRGPYATGVIEARALLQRYEANELRNPNICRQYFRNLFANVPLDTYHVQPFRTDLNYPEVADRYKLIRDPTVPVVVDYGEGLERLRDWHRDADRRGWQRIQPFLVSIYERDATYNVSGRLETVPGSVIMYRWLGDYDERLGIADILADPSDLVYVV